MKLEAWRRSGATHGFKGHSIFFHDDGEKMAPALFCLHGFPTASWDWHRLWPRLRDRFRLVAPDFIGFGFSAKPRAFPYSISAQADLCEDLCAALGLRSVHLLAHDFGDTVAQELLARAEETAGRLEILSVCLLNGGIFPEANRPRAIQKLLLSPIGPVVTRLLTEGRFRRSFSAIFAEQSRPGRAELDEFWELINCNGGRLVVPTVIQYLKERDRFRRRWVGALTGAPVPVRFINGTQDSISGPRMVARYRELMPSPDVVEIPEAGHYPQLETPRRVAEAILTWSKRQSSTRDAEQTEGNPGRNR